MSYLVRALIHSISHTRNYKDDSCWSVDLKSNTTEDVISIGSFMEVLAILARVVASVVNVSLKTIVGNSVSTDPRHGYAVSSLMEQRIDVKPVGSSSLTKGCNSSSNNNTERGGMRVDMVMEINNGTVLRLRFLIFFGNLNLEDVLDWLYEVEKFSDIMDVPEEEQVKIVAYKLRFTVAYGSAGSFMVPARGSSLVPVREFMLGRLVCSLLGHRSNESPKRNLIAYVGGNHEGEMGINFGDDLEHIVEFAQVEGEVMNLMVKGSEVKVNEVCKILIDIGNFYHDVVSCDIVDLESSHVCYSLRCNTLNHVKP
ncbi:hypothetical protein Tco_1238701 [Tanacetum coccineum]